MPGAVVTISPFIDMAASGSSYQENGYKDPLYAMPKGYPFEQYEKKLRRISPYCGSTPLTHPDLFPAYADFAGFPKTLIQCGCLETSLSDSQMLYQGLSGKGCFAKLHIFDEMWHDFMDMVRWLKESRTAWNERIRFISSICPRAVSETGRVQCAVQDFDNTISTGVTLNIVMHQWEPAPEKDIFSGALFFVLLKKSLQRMANPIDK